MLGLDPKLAGWIWGPGIGSSALWQWLETCAVPWFTLQCFGGRQSRCWELSLPRLSLEIWNNEPFPRLGGECVSCHKALCS